MQKYWQQIDIYSINTLQRNALPVPLNAHDEPCVLSLDGEWRFRFYPSVDQFDELLLASHLDDEALDTIKVPGEWQIAGYGTPIYTNTTYPYPIDVKHPMQPHIDDSINPCGFYTRTFRLDDVPTGRVLLRFDGIGSCGIVYVNGKEVGYSEDTFDYVAYDITDHVTVGENRLSVLVVQFSTGSYLEDQDMWRLSGIFRSVSLQFVNNAHLTDAYLYADFDPDLGHADLHCELATEGVREGMTCRIRMPGLGVEATVPAAETCACVLQHLGGYDLWTHETPNLYEVVIELSDGAVVLDRRRLRFGFRQVGIRKDEASGQPYVALNGRLIKICGVNRHDFHPEYGHAVPPEITRSDLLLLKANNVTSIRTCHYPNPAFFYDMCDELGILVMCENNLETHGLAHRIPRNSDLWRPMLVYRMQNMVRSYRNHSSIIFWSLGNESGVGDSFLTLREAALSLDKTRLIHYEPDCSASDVLSEMYTVQTKMKRIAANKTIIHCRNSWNLGMGYLMPAKNYRDKPFLLCEYSHCMGNSLGNFGDYWDDFDANPRLIGGYIWDFADQSIKRVVDGQVQWTMGGDWGDKPNDGVFAFNGILRADRSPNPAFYEVRKVYQRISCTLRDGVLHIHNKQSFSTLDDYSMQLQLLRDGLPVLTKTYDCAKALPHLKPFDTVAFVPEPDLMSSEGETTLVVRFLRKTACEWAPVGDVVAYDWFAIHTPAVAHTHPKGNVEFKQGKETLQVYAGEVVYTIDIKQGSISGIRAFGKEYLETPITVEFWRAYTNNDRYPPNNFVDLSKLLQFGAFRRAMNHLHCNSLSIDKKDGHLEVACHMAMPYVVSFVVTYSFYVDGTLRLSMQFMPLRNLVRYGFRMGLAKGLDGVRYYGLGEHECYNDRCRNALPGVYTKTGEEMTHDYLSPQENGNRMDVRWACVADTVRFVAVSHPFQLGVHPYTREMLEQATHLHELGRLDYLCVNLDGAQRGVGGDFPAMTLLKPQYRLKPFRTYMLTVDMNILR